MAHIVAMRLKDTLKLVSRLSWSIIARYKDLHNQVADDYAFSDLQIFKFLHNLVFKGARLRYLKNAKLTAASYQKSHSAFRKRLQLKSRSNNS